VPLATSTPQTQAPNSQAKLPNSQTQPPNSQPPGSIVHTSEGSRGQIKKRSKHLRANSSKKPARVSKARRPRPRPVSTQRKGLRGILDNCILSYYQLPGAQVHRRRTRKPRPTQPPTDILTQLNN